MSWQWLNTVLLKTAVFHNLLKINQLLFIDGLQR